MSFNVSMETSETTTINYALALTEIEEGETLKSDKVKIYLEKEGKGVNTFEENKGQTIESFKNKYVEGLIDNYAGKELLGILKNIKTNIVVVSSNIDDTLKKK